MEPEASRPLSPHLSAYRPQLTSVLSILHRITGVGLVLGLPFFSLWFLAAALGESSHAAAQAVFGSFLGRVFLLGWTVAFYYHLCNGVRHLLWDVESGLELSQVYRSGYVVLACTVVFTLASWAIAYMLR